MGEILNRFLELIIPQLQLADLEVSRFVLTIDRDGLLEIALCLFWVVLLSQGSVTRLYPSNEELIQEGQAMEQAPDLVYRRLNFPQGIPAGYRWTADADAPQVELGGMGTQRMTVDTWLEVIEREEASGTGHVGPTGVGNLPRPKERGGCDCEACARNREVMERRAG